MRNKENFKEIIRFCICGGIATAVDFFVFGIVIYLIAPESFGNNLINSLFADRDLIPTKSVLWGTAAGFSAGLVINYIISVLFVYRYTVKAKTAAGIILFIVLSITGLILNVVLMKISYQYLGLNHWIAKILVTGAVFVYNYLTKRLLVFRPDSI